jgi:hypothetical protein
MSKLTALIGFIFLAVSSAWAQTPAPTTPAPGATPSSPLPGTLPQQVAASQTTGGLSCWSSSLL